VVGGRQGWAAAGGAAAGLSLQLGWRPGLGGRLQIGCCRCSAAGAAAGLPGLGLPLLHTRRQVCSRPGAHRRRQISSTPPRASPLGPRPPPPAAKECGLHSGNVKGDANGNGGGERKAERDLWLAGGAVEALSQEQVRRQPLCRRGEGALRTCACTAAHSCRSRVALVQRGAAPRP
jgi:hypothetical protein